MAKALEHSKIYPPAGRILARLAQTTKPIAGATTHMPKWEMALPACVQLQDRYWLEKARQPTKKSLPESATVVPLAQIAGFIAGATTPTAHWQTARQHKEASQLWR